MIFEDGEQFSAEEWLQGHDGSKVVETGLTGKIITRARLEAVHEELRKLRFSLDEPGHMTKVFRDKDPNLLELWY